MIFKYVLSFILLVSVSCNSYSIGWSTVAKAFGYTLIAPLYIEYKIAEGMVRGTVATHDYLTTPEIVTQLQNKYSKLIALYNSSSGNKRDLRQKLLRNIGYINEFINTMNYDIYSLDKVNHNAAKSLQQTLSAIRNILAFYE